MTANERDLLLTGTAWLDALWDDAAQLIQNPDLARGNYGDQKTRYMIRESVFYALGLLQRRHPDDVARALRTLETVLAYQFWAPETPYHGTFRRSPEEPTPGADAVMWQDYDPNWRQFIGTSLALVLLNFSEDLPQTLSQRLEQAVELCVLSETETRVEPSYSNIALLKAWLECFAGNWFGRPELTAKGTELARAVVERFSRFNAFDEYNSPTYYGIDLCALGLWRENPFGTELKDWAEELEAKLWLDVGQFYHAGLKNLSGPFDRSYGVDMTRYAASLGLWLWALLGREAAPFPEVTAPFVHSADFSLAPWVALLGTDVPEAAKAHFEAFLGERRLERTLPGEPERKVTAYLTHNFMVGAQSAYGQVRVPEQFCPVVAYWRKRDASIGWLRLSPEINVEAHVDAYRLQLNFDQILSTAEWAVGLDDDSRRKAELTGATLQLPGLKVELSNAVWRLHEDRSLSLVTQTMSRSASLLFLPRPDPFHSCGGAES